MRSMFPTRSLASFSFGLFLLTACAGAQRSAKSADSDDAKTDVAEGDASNANASANADSSEGGDGTPSWMGSTRGGSKGAPLTEKDHATFTRACTKGSGEPNDDKRPFCECSWQVAKDSGDVSQATLAQRMAARCADKLPEATVRKTFVNGCQKDGPSLKPYCECMWPEIRKSFSVGELAQSSTIKSAKFDAALKAGANVCGAKLPEETLQRGFMKGCTDGDDAKNAYCTCAWRVVRGSMSPAEIVAPGASESPKMKAVIGTLPKKCGAFRK